MPHVRPVRHLSSLFFLQSALPIPSVSRITQDAVVCPRLFSQLPITNYRSLGSYISEKCSLTQVLCGELKSKWAGHRETLRKKSYNVET